ncbi:MAG: LapA family protein [Gammaproteobacteria bacterium]|jgi:lipopolysaccharide assembly protein A|nr:LapA family protein [Gammaproteobacteria bacterium]MBT4493529.1 LapA family protein [Gammaproteobacteria bacterium]MBT7370456.1 LapA family protein [Gammaproteobacteria bacterium]
MIFLRKTLFFILAIFLFVIALLAAADNSEAVSLKFIDWASPSWPISWWMLMAFVIGIFFGILLNLYSNTRLRLDARAANKNAASRTRELDRARAEPESGSE